MKKIIYLFLFSLLACATISSCTEEEVVPSTELNGGGHVSDPK